MSGFIFIVILVVLGVMTWYFGNLPLHGGGMSQAAHTSAPGAATTG